MADPESRVYPAMLAALQPDEAAQTFDGRIKRINKINLEIADWLLERRRIEEQYINGLRKLAQINKGPNSQSDLGLLSAPWTQTVKAVERIAQSHEIFCQAVAEQVERPLRLYHQDVQYSNMSNVSSNLGNLAKTLQDAQNQAEKLNKKGKANDAVSAKLRDASQAWDAEAPLIFENLEDLDAARIRRLRDRLDQYQGQESEQAARLLEIAEETRVAVASIDDRAEIQDFASRTVGGRAPLPARTPTRPSTGAARQSSFDQPPPPMPNTDTFYSTASAPAGNPPPSGRSQSQQEDEFNEQLGNDQPRESKLRRLGTLFGRRRQSVIGGFGSLPSGPGAKTGPPPPMLGRLGSSHGRGVSPRASSGNLHESGRLASLAETPDVPPLSRDGSANETSRLHNGTNGVNGKNGAGAPGVNGTSSANILGGAPSVGHASSAGLVRDPEGFTVRAPMNDPISEAQREAAGEEADQILKLNIHNKPLDEEDPTAKQAALSSVANTLKMGSANRRASTLRGRRDVRNTVYVPPPSGAQFESTLQSIAGSPPLPGSSSFKSPMVNALASEASVAGTSDSQSIRSGHSLGNIGHAKHPDLTGPGLQSSIIETVSAFFEDGAIKSASVAGELAFVNNDARSSPDKTHETIRINNFPRLERIGPNRIFVQNASPDQPDQFALDLSHLTKTSIAFSYKVFAEEADAASSLAKHAPILLRPAWKPQDDKLGLLLQYQLNPSSSFTAPVTLHNVVLVATYEGRAVGAQTKPSGTHLKDKHLVYWRLGDVSLTSDVQKIVCRIVGADGSCPTAGRIEARWEYVASGDKLVGSGISASRLADADKGKGKEVSAEDDADPFADAGSSASQTWVDVPAVRKLVGGKYESR